MRPDLPRLLSAFLFAFALLSSGLRPVAAQQPATLLWGGENLRGIAPATDGSTAVWLAQQIGATNFNILAAPLPDGEAFVVAEGPGNRAQPAISGDTVVWSEDRDVVGKQLATGNRLAIATSSAEEHSPAIDGTLVAWVETGEAETLKVRDVSTDAPTITVATAQPGWTIEPPVIEGERLVWGEVLASPRTGSQWRLLTRLIGSEEAPQVVAEGTGAGSFGLVGYDFSGNTIAYTANQTVLAYNLAAGRFGQYTKIAEAAGRPTTNGRYVFWEDYRNFVVNERLDLGAFDTVTNSRFDVSAANGYNVTPHADGNAIVWQRGGGDQTTIHAALVSNILPTAPQPPPTIESPERFYFPETDHYLAYGFRNFWLENGGLPVFGFSLTEEYDELNPDDDTYYTVQYFERQRYEYHPENQSTPYETELGRLGVAVARLYRLFETPAFQPLPAGTAPGADCIMIEETRHTVCGPFLRYWQTHGLEFGDPGISFRESLALFGYPISEAYTDPTTGRMVQYFERARFEYHPDNPAEYQVLLGRLGAILLRERGW